ncbi:MAG: formylglycine-generating enzyme family protein [Planctomycetaceae bacterium]
MTGSGVGAERCDNRLKLRLAWCPPGTFRMGSLRSERWRQADETRVRVTLTHGFWLGKYEVTQAEWRAQMRTSPWRGVPHGATGPRLPASNISWDGAWEFVSRLTRGERRASRLPPDWEYTLPTEAQWEYACRAGSTTVYCFGNDSERLSDYAWWGGEEGDGNARGVSHAREVGQRQPNGWGLHDLHGNVCEWCRDTYAETLPGGRDPLVEDAAATHRVIRGGTWNWRSRGCRSASRGLGQPETSNILRGFRVALCPIRAVE